MADLIPAEPRTGNAATVDATGMQVDQLCAVAQNIGKVAADGISGGVVIANPHTAPPVPQAWLAKPS